MLLHLRHHRPHEIIGNRLHFFPSMVCFLFYLLSEPRPVPCSEIFRRPADSTTPGVHANLPSARGALPFLPVEPEELPDPGLLDKLKVLYRTCMVLGTVSFVQQPQPVTRDLVAPEAEPRSVLAGLAARLHLAPDAGGRFVGLVRSAAGTAVPRSQVRCANGAVEAAGSDELGMSHRKNV